MDKEVEKLSRFAKQYKRRAAQDPVERWPDLLKVKYRAKQSKNGTLFKLGKPAL